ncbi:MAG: hypothetical protein ACN0LA_15410 [Candidatus Longimicrobiales bacterium M2_2A_002]
MTDLARWLDERASEAPPSVRLMVEERVAETDPSAPLHDRLAAAGLTALEDVVARPSERRTAATLLAADALLTYACEAAAEEGLATLDRLTESLDFERFSHLIHEET